MKVKIFLTLIGIFFLTGGCAVTSYFGVQSRALNVPDEFGQTEATVQKAEESPGAQYCPEKVAKARELGKKGVEVYWACRTKEALGLLAESRKLAEEAMLCKAPPKPSKPLDSDGDGVYDDRDKCPGTPKGVEVDSRGCPLDTDRDGVYDYLDKCPGTPKGAKVDERGCWVLKGVYFETAKWSIKPESYPVLDEVVDVLKRNPGVKVEIQGHTDNVGKAKYNQVLSEKRAKSVMEYLMNKGVNSTQLSYKGYGLQRPIATNETPEGRSKNRRVELKPLF